MDENLSPHVVITGRDEKGPAIDVEALMKGGASLDAALTAIDEDGAQPDLSGFVKSAQKSRSSNEILAEVSATAVGKGNPDLVAKVAAALK